MKTKTAMVTIFCFMAICNSLLLSAQAPYGNPGEQTPVTLGSSELSFGYYEYLPTDFDETSDQTYPVIISYHGYSDRGNGTSDLSNVISTGPANLIRLGGDLDAIVISPQSDDADFTGSDFLNIYNYLISNYPIDLNRVYVTGLSSGGSSTWHALVAHYDKIAAAVPVCGYRAVNNPSGFMQQTPIWAFHSFDDQVIDVSRTITNMDRIADISNSVMADYPYVNGSSAATEDYTMKFNSIGQTWSTLNEISQPNSNLTFTLYKDGGHDAWTRAYNNEDVWDWMFAQSLNVNQNVLSTIEEEVIDFKLYPNPATNEFTISSQNETEKKIDLYDILGNIIYSNTFLKEHTVNTTAYASGVYFARVASDNNNQKVVKIILK